MNQQQNTNKRTEIKPTEISRWEGEGGNPPTPIRKDERTHSVSGILRRLLVDWHLINSNSHKN